MRNLLIFHTYVQICRCRCQHIAYGQSLFLQNLDFGWNALARNDGAFDRVKEMAPQHPDWNTGGQEQLWTKMCPIILLLEEFRTRLSRPLARHHVPAKLVSRISVFFCSPVCSPFKFLAVFSRNICVDKQKTHGFISLRGQNFPGVNKC